VPERGARDFGANGHIDTCTEGVTLAFLERLGEPIPLWDFRVPGVTSISIDLQKCGSTAKGASATLHRPNELRRYQTFATQNWIGRICGSSDVLGTKWSGARLAALGSVLDPQGSPASLLATVTPCMGPCSMRSSPTRAWRSCRSATAARADQGPDPFLKPPQEAMISGRSSRNQE